MDPSEHPAGTENQPVRGGRKQLRPGRREEFISLATGAAGFLLMAPQMLSIATGWPVAEVLGKAYVAYLLVIPVLGIVAIATGNHAINLRMKTTPMATIGLALGWLDVVFSMFILVVLFIIFSSL